MQILKIRAYLKHLQRYGNNYCSTMVTSFAICMIMALTLCPMGIQVAYAQPTVCQDLFANLPKTTVIVETQNRPSNVVIRGILSFAKTFQKSIQAQKQNIYFQIALKELQYSLWIGSYAHTFNISKYKNLTAAQYFILAKLYIEKGNLYSADLSQRINFKALSSDQLFEIGKILSKRTGLHEEDIKLFEALNSDQLFEMAKITASNTSYYITILKSLSRLNLSPEQIFEIAKISTTKYGAYALSQLIENGSTALIPKHLHLKLIKIALRNASTSAEKTAIYLFLKTLNFHSSQIAISERFLKFLFPYEFTSVLWPGGIKILSAHNRDIPYEISTIQSIDELKAYFLSPSIMAFIPDLKNHSQIINMAWDRIQKRETGLLLIEHALRLLARGQVIPKNSLALLAKVSGLKLEFLPAKISKDTLGKIYELTLDIQNSLYGPFFSKLEIDPEIYKNPHLLLELLSTVRDYSALHGNNRQATLNALALLGSQKIDSHRIKFIVKNIQDAIIKKIQILLSSPELNISYEKVKKLEELWGNLDPIFTLISRFNGTSEWKSLLSDLVEIFEASINGEFQNYKFFGNPKNLQDQKRAQTQLSAFKTNRAKLEWIKPRAFAHVAETSSKSSYESEILINIKNIFRNNLLPHLNITPKHLHRDRQMLDFIISQQAGAKETYERLVENFKLDRTEPEIHKQILIKILSHFETLELNQVSKVIRFLQLLITKDASLVDLDLKEKVDQDFASILNTLTTPSSEVTPASLLLTVVNSEPKFLMTIGDLVKTYSCQNYKTGTHIETLLGYVKDANIQGMASFSLEATQFQTREDFEKIYAAYQSNSRPTVEFNGNLLIATFTLTSGEKIETNSLEGKAYIRQIIKAGANLLTRRSALYLENPYTQGHNAMTQMVSQQEELFNVILKATNSTKTGPIRIYGSRNSQGHYSDAAGGKKTTDYIIIP